MIYVYTDGASRNNPGKSASGYLIFGDEAEAVIKYSFYNGIKTNNEAEYLAIIAALEKVGDEFGFDVEVFLRSDSQLVVNQLNGTYKVKDSGLKELHAKASELIKKFKKCTLAAISREDRYITMVDAELNKLLDQQTG